MNKNLLKDNVKSIIKNIEAQAEHNRVSLEIVEDEMKNGCDALKEQVKKGKAPGGAKEDVKALKKIVEKAYAKIDTKDFYVDDFTGQAMVAADDVSKRLKKAYKKYVSKQEEKLANKDADIKYKSSDLYVSANAKKGTPVLDSVVKAESKIAEEDEDMER